MSYNHAGDLPDNYIFHDATNIIKNPGLRSIWHESAEKGNFLNEIGHSAIQRSLMSMAGSDDSEFGGLGATIYEIVTMPDFTEASPEDAPTYHDPSGMSVAMRTAFSLESQPPVEALQAAYANVAALEEQTPATSSLIDWSAKDILGVDITKSELLKIKVGAALMQRLHIEAHKILLNET